MLGVQLSAEALIGSQSGQSNSFRCSETVALNYDWNFRLNALNCLQDFFRIPLACGAAHKHSVRLHGLYSLKLIVELIARDETFTVQARGKMGPCMRGMPADP